MTTLYRAFTPDLEIRSDGDGRTIRGIAVPWGRPTRIDSRLVEQFARGAANHQLRAAHRMKFAREHTAQGGQLIGVTKLLRDDAAGLYGEWRASRTPLGDETIELVKDGALRHLSVGFKERRNRNLPGGIVERVKADFIETAVVPEGAYGDAAAIAGVRSAAGEWGPDIDLELEDELVLEHARAAAGLPGLDEARQILAGFRPLPPPV